MQMKMIVASVAAVCSLAAAPGAWADDIPLGALDLGTLPQDGSFVSFGGPIAAAGEAFSTSFGFDLTALADVAGSVWGSQSPILAAGISAVALDGNVSPSTSSFSFTGLQAGHHVLTLSGSASGTYGGLYGGNLHTVTPVIPEPSSYAMLLAGLLVLGWPKLRLMKPQTSAERRTTLKR